MFAITQPPAKQTATDTIQILSGRLQSATLLEDRRNAILGLRSFARKYPASVASGALRGLIGSLSKDSEDVDTIKVVLETLLMLFNPDDNSSEASEEITLWLADEFTQRQENITTLLDLLEKHETYSRLYSLQLLSAILSARTERTEECIFMAPLGISRLVAILDDRQEAVRNEGLLLLTFLTPNSAELQKLVAFENAFERIFRVIKLEGSLSQGDRVVEDCLILLANLLRMNTSNQSYFRETGCVAKLAQLFADVAVDQNPEGEVAEWVRMQRNRNVYALLAVLRLFLVRGGGGTFSNQSSFVQHGLLVQALKLGFSKAIESQIKAEAIITCADIIWDNRQLQEGFAQLQVTSNPSSLLSSDGQIQYNGTKTKVYVIDGLLDLMLSHSSIQDLDLRLAACECIKAYFSNHPVIKLHFLRRAVDGHTSGADETANVLTTLLRPSTSGPAVDPYRFWFASVIMFHLIFEGEEAKTIAMAVTEGDASKGEEVVTCIQTVAANLAAGIQRSDDDRVLVSYLMLLIGWLFEDPDAVNDFLGEIGNVQILLRKILHGDRDSDIVRGLCAVLLGMLYEFSTKDSPLPRASLHALLSSSLGRDRYIDRLTKLRRHPLIRDFEVLPQKLSLTYANGLPEILFDKVFVEFLKDNFSRLLRALDRDPGLEIPVILNGVRKGISRELVESLRSQVEEKEKAFQQLQTGFTSQHRQLDQENSDLRKSKDAALLEVARVEAINEALQARLEQEIDHLQTENKVSDDNFKRQLDYFRRTAEGEAERIRRRAETELAEFKVRVVNLEAKSSEFRAKIAGLEDQLEHANSTHSHALQTARDDHGKEIHLLTEQLNADENKTAKLQKHNAFLQQELADREILLDSKESQRLSVQNELDDLLMVFGDLEERVNKYKLRLSSLGEVVSDGEGEEETTAQDEIESISDPATDEVD